MAVVRTRGSGGGTGGGGLRLRRPVDVFTGANLAGAESARNTYFQTTSPAALAEFAGDPSLAILLRVTGQSDAFQTYLGAPGDTYDADDWVDRTDVVQGETGGTGEAGRDGNDGSDGADGVAGTDGRDGADGAPGQGIYIAFSADGSSWHEEPTANDLYVRFATGTARPSDSDASWGVAIRFVGEDGEDGEGGTGGGGSGAGATTMREAQLAYQLAQSANRELNSIGVRRSGESYRIVPERMHTTRIASAIYITAWPAGQIQLDEQNWRRSEAVAGAYYVGLELADELTTDDIRVSEYRNNAVVASYPNEDQVWTRLTDFRAGVPGRSYYRITDTGGTATTVTLSAGSSLWLEDNVGNFAFLPNAIPPTALDLADAAKKAAARALLGADAAHAQIQITVGYGNETRSAADTAANFTVPVGERFYVRTARADRNSYRFVTLPADHVLASIIGESGEDIDAWARSGQTWQVGPLSNNGRDPETFTMLVETS